MLDKIEWQGRIISIQSRTRVWRYKTDNRTHYHIGYNLFLEGVADGVERQFVMAISEKQQHVAARRPPPEGRICEANVLKSGGFRIGDEIKGTAWEKEYPEREFADYYRAGALKFIAKASATAEQTPPPWVTDLPDMKTYEDRGARMLCKSRWKSNCFTCIWATMSNVEIAWNIDKKKNKYRYESFCYGPKSCKNYKMGKPRSVPYYDSYNSMDEGWLDALITEGRDYDE